MSVPSAHDAFIELIDLDATARAAWLAAHPLPDDARARLDELLARYDARPGRLTLPAFRDQFGVDPIALLPRFDPFDRLDEFEIVSRLGEGGMGVVYLATDQTLLRRVAIKLVPTTLLRGAAGELYKEAQSAARVDHPGIVRVYRVGDHDHFMSIVMEYIEGGTLAEWTERTRRAEGAVPERRAVEIVHAVADALHHAHESGILHRDVKPANILMDEDGQPHLTDFGIATDTAMSADDMRRAGTLPYISPEQARLLEVDVGAPSDVYSLGVVLYELLTGSTPHTGRTAEELLQRVADEPPRRVRAVNPRVNRDLEVVVHTALAKDPAARYDSARAFADDLRAVLDGRPIAARPPGVVRRLREQWRRHRTAVLVTTTVTLMLLLGVGIGMELVRRDRMFAQFVVASSLDDGEVVVRRIYGANQFGKPERHPLTEEPIRLAPGFYQVTVTDPDGTRHQTIAVDVGPAGTIVRIEMDPPVADAGFDDMIYFAGGTVTLGPPGPLPPHLDHLTERTVTVEPFYLDRDEVTNGEYETFLLERELEWPSHWPSPERMTARFRAQPVVGITWAEASAYAASIGKRLPFYAEWEFAAGGADHRRYPWGDDPEGHVLPTDAAERAAEPTDWPSRRNAYDTYMRPAAQAYSSDVTPEGVINLFGNAREYVFEAIDDPDGRRALYRGQAWFARPSAWSVFECFTSPIETTSMLRGFRCARSARAPFLPADRSDS